MPLVHGDCYLVETREREKANEKQKNSAQKNIANKISPRCVINDLHEREATKVRAAERDERHANREIKRLIPQTHSPLSLSRILKSSWRIMRPCKKHIRDYSLCQYQRERRNDVLNKNPGAGTRLGAFIFHQRRVDFLRNELLLERRGAVVVQRYLIGGEKVNAVPSKAAAVLENSLDVPHLSVAHIEIDLKRLAVCENLAAEDILFP